MKLIKHSARFRRHYRLRIAHNEALQEQFLAAVDAFLHDATLMSDHALTGKQAGKAAFWINAEYRVIYVETKDYILFFDIGTHDQVYQR